MFNKFGSLALLLTLVVALLCAAIFYTSTKTSTINTNLSWMVGTQVPNWKLTAIATSAAETITNVLANNNGYKLVILVSDHCVSCINLIKQAPILPNDMPFILLWYSKPVNPMTGLNKMSQFVIEERNIDAILPVTWIVDNNDKIVFDFRGYQTNLWNIILDVVDK